MIDTDKYENITPERWTVDEYDPYLVVDTLECAIAKTDFLVTAEERERRLAYAQFIADAPLLLAEVKRLQAYKEFADGIFEWSHGAAHIHFLAEQVNHIRNTDELDEDALNHGCQQYYNGPNSASQVSEKEYKDLLAEVKRLRERVKTEKNLKLWEKSEVKRLHEVIKKIKDCATINAQHDDILEKQEWEYILEMIE